MKRLGLRRVHSDHRAVLILGLGLMVLTCAPLASLATAWAAPSCPWDGELSTRCFQALRVDDAFPGLVSPILSPEPAILSSDFLTPVAVRTAGALHSTPAWSVRAPPAIV